MKSILFLSIFLSIIKIFQQAALIDNWTQYLPCGYANPQTPSDCDIATTRTGFSCCLVQKAGKNQCVLLTGPIRKQVQNTTDTTVICLTSSSFISIKTSSLILLIFIYFLI